MGQAVATNVSGQVSQWNDKSAGGRNLSQGTSAARPKTGTRTIGGLHAIEFDGTDDVMTGTANKTAAITIFGVVLADAGSGTDGNRSWLSSPGGSNPDYWMKAPANSDTLGAQMCDTAGAYASGGGAAARDQAHTIGAHSWVANGADGYARVDGGASGSAIAAQPNNVQQAATELAIGRQKNVAGRFHDGLVGEVIIINSRLTEADADFLKIEGYLAHKWGLAANLPSGHPYKSAPPGCSGTIANLAPTGISDVAATFKAALAAPGTNYDVTVYHGTTDGGTNAGSWALSATVGSWTNVASTNISHAAVGLTAGHVYYYTFMASNAAGVVWASPSWTFKTPGAAQPVTASHSVPHAWLSAQNAAWSGDYEAAVLDDPDGDRFSTWQEYWSGTDPQNSNSFLRIKSITYEGGHIVIEWENAAVDGGLPPLGIQARMDLINGSWSNAGQKSVANGVNAWSNSPLQQLFYRLAVTNAP